jgi:hypothetical protein
MVAGTTIATFTNSSTDFIIETATSDKDIIFKVNDGGSSTEVARFDGDVSAFKVASGKKIMLGAAEESISGDGTDITFAVGSSGDINIPADIGLTFGDDGEKIEGDGTDLTISGNNINLTATADVNIPSGVGLTFATAEKIESDGTDLSITVGSNGDINIPANIGLTFGDDGEKIEGDGTDLTISASALATIDAGTDITLDADGGDIFFKDGGTTFGSATNTSGNLIIKSGTTTALTFSGANATFAGTLATAAGGFNIAGLDIDGATDIGADIVDADLFIVDDGAGGTNRKVAASRIKTYIGGGTQWQAVKTSNFTASAGQGVFCNTTSAAFTLTLPSSPSIGDEVSFIDYAGTFDSYNLTIARNSEKIHGASEDLTVATERAANTLVYTDGTQGWLLKSK